MTHPDPQRYRFSEAPIWALQRAYFEERGIEAWQNDEVPQYITNNPFIAGAYAEMIFGFLQDRAQLDEKVEPVTIVELGAGSGRLAHRILQELVSLIEFAGIPLPPFRYVLTDLPEKNISYWQQHPSLQPYVEQGVLDFARLDAMQDTELSLIQSGTRIGAGDLQQPLLIVANYFFDSIPQELVYVEEGQIYDCQVSLQYPDNAAELSASKLLASVIPTYHYRRIADDEQAASPCRDLLALYAQKLEEAHILVPEAGLNCLERLGKLSQAGFVLITADKGDHRLENWEFAEPPKLIHHGSFSLTANYHAIQQVWEAQGALTCFTDHPHRNLNVGCVLMVPEPMRYVHTRLAYKRFIDRFGPDDFFSMKLWLDDHVEQLGLTYLLTFWRLSGYDAEWFRQSAQRIAHLLPTGKETDLTDIQAGIRQMWAGYYPMQEERALALTCGKLLYELELFEDARGYLERSLNGQVPDTSVGYALAICCYEAGDEAAALAYVESVLEREPSHEEALALQELLNGAGDWA